MKPIKMKPISFKNSRLVSILLLSIAAAYASAQTLIVGAEAPPVKVGAWVKGTPVQQFEPGKVYVVEFWATWCIPCKESIPHLTDLAKQFAGKATFIGVSTYENPQKDQPYDSTLPLVRRYVTRMGGQMEYNVAADDNDLTMSKTWMTAAGQTFIPAAFVVEQKGRIAWIGDPRYGLDKVLSQVIAGTYDVDAAAAAKRAESDKTKMAEEKEKADYAAWQKTPLGMKFTESQELMKQKNYKAASAVYDEIGKSAPDSRIKDPVLSAAIGKYNIYQKTGDMDGFYKACNVMFDHWNGDAQGLIDSGQDVAKADGSMTDLAMVAFSMNNGLSWLIANPKSILPRKDYDFAIKVAKRVVEITHRQNANWLDTLGWAYYGKGDKDTAIATEQEAIALCKGRGDSDYQAALKVFQGN
jgi:thiol-disulfide isomerase/thioredoxin